METKIKETIKYTHKDIDIWVKIDYRNNRIDIVEPRDIDEGNFRKKEFVFIGRGVQYMNSWRLILEALDKAIEFAKEKYEKQLEITSRLQKEKQVEILKALGGLENEK